MLPFPHLLLALGFIAFAATASAQKYGCAAGDKVGVGVVTGIGLKPLVEGVDPAISPDGSKLAYTKMDSAGNRAIAVVDAAGGQGRVLPGIPGDNNYGPVWSPDGKFIYFNHFKDSDWTIGRVNAEGGDFRIIYDKSVAFAVFPDGQKLLCNDMEKFFVLTLDGDKATAGPALPVDPKFEGTSIPCRIDVSPDAATALFEMLVGADAEPSKFDGMPPSSVWQINLANGSITRMTPKGMNAMYPAWLPDGRSFLFSTYPPTGTKTEIFRIDATAGSKPRVIAENADQPTVARDSTASTGLLK